MATYYVSSSAGSDSNNGTSTLTPFATFAHVEGVAVQGDTVLLKCGDTWTTPYTSTVGITLSYYGSTGLGLPTIALQSGVYTAITCTNCGGYSVNGLNIVGAGYVFAAHAQLVLFANTNNGAYSNISITNCTLSNGQCGITAYATGTGTLTNINIQGNQLTNFAGFGIFTDLLSSQSYINVTVKNNIVTNCTGYNSTSNICMGIYVGGANGGTVSGNLVSQIGQQYINTGGGGPTGIGIENCTGVTVKNNVSHDIFTDHSNPVDGHCYDLDLTNTNCTFTGNFGYNSDGPGILLYTTDNGNSVSFNTFVNCARIFNGGITGLNTGAVNVFNNTVVQQTGTFPAIYIDSTGDTAGKAFYNNLLITPSGTPTVKVPTSTTGFALQGNAYLSGSGFSATYNGTNYTSLASWRTATGQETGTHGYSLTSNPCLAPSPVPAVTPSNFDLVWAYGLKSGSSLLQGGLNLASLYSITLPATDLVGEAITGSTLSVGAINNALSYTLTGPTTGIKGLPSTNFTITPSSAVSDTITLSDGASGVFTPSSLTFASSSTPQTFTYTPSAVGTFTLTFTSALGATISGSPVSYVSTPAYQWEYVQSASSNNPPFITSTTATFGSTVAKGDLIVVSVTLGATETPTISDNEGNTYTSAVTLSNMSLWYAIAASAGVSTVTATVGTGTGLSMAIGEYSYPPGSTVTCEHTEYYVAPTYGTAVSTTSVPVTMPDLVVMAVNLGGTTNTVTAGSPFVARQTQSGLFGSPGIYLQDCANPSSSPVPSTATLASVAYWTAISGAFQATAPTYELLGPANVASGSPAAFSLVPTGTITADTVTPSDGGFGGTFSPTSLVFSSSPFAQAFTYTPSRAGLARITLSSSSSYTIGAAPWSLGSYVNFTLSGPTNVLVGVSSTYTLTPVSTTSDTITFSDGGAGGTFTPNSLSFGNSSAPQSFTYTPAEAGSPSLALTSADGATITGSPLAVTSVATVVSAYVCKSGKLAIFGVAGSSGESNGAYPLSSVKAVNSNPTIKVNGRTISIGPATWLDSDHSSPIVAYLLKCGGVQSITVSNGGANYTSPSATWNNDGGGTGLTIGSPVLGSGITSYTITAPGAGLTNGTYQVAISGGTQTTWATGANALVTVAGGVVTAVVPMAGSVQGYGSGYTSSSFTYSFTAAGGSAATITCQVSNYIQSIPVTSHGTGFTSPPTFTITDSSGSARSRSRS